MAFVQLEDAGGQKIEAIVFPKTLEKYETLWEDGNIILVTGKISDKDGTLKIIADEVRIVNQDEIDRYDILEKQRKKESASSADDPAKAGSKLFITLPSNASKRRIGLAMMRIYRTSCKG